MSVHAQGLQLPYIDAAGRDFCGMMEAPCRVAFQSTHRSRTRKVLDARRSAAPGQAPPVRMQRHSSRSMPVEEAESAVTLSD